MDYKEFLTEIQKRILEYMPEQYQDAEVTIRKIIKNNNTEHMALELCRQSKEISPLIYLEQPFVQYQEGKSVEEIIKQLVNICLNKPKFEIPNVKELISDFEKVQGFLRLQIINKEYNNKKLYDIPYKNLDNTDLAVVFRIYLPTQEVKNATVSVSNSLLFAWNKTIDDIYPVALQNTMLANPARIDSMIHIITKTSDEYMKNEIKNFQIEPYEQYVLGNLDGMNGAAVLLYPNILEQLAQNAGANLFILPSSIHEVILMQDTGELDAKELQAIVMSINSSEVLPEEKLSDEVYYYNKNEHCLSMATDRVTTKQLEGRLIRTKVTELEQVPEMEMEV